MNKEGLKISCEEQESRLTTLQRVGIIQNQTHTKTKLVVRVCLCVPWQSQ